MATAKPASSPLPIECPESAGAISDELADLVAALLLDAVLHPARTEEATTQ